MTGSGTIAASFSMQALQVLGRGRGALWDVLRVWLSPHTDAAFFSLTPRSDLAAKHSWRCPQLELLPPRQGERVVGFGYHSSTITLIEDEKSITVEWYDEPATTVGEVMEVHEQLRDSSRLRFPCFRTNARFDGGMSGGPVVNEDGMLCGLVCSALPASAAGEEDVSYAALLWPAMGTILDMPRSGFPADESYPALDLARDGFIDARGWEQVKLFPKSDGQFQVGLKLPE